MGENVQPRIIGRPGTMLLGIGGHLDRMFTADADRAWNYTINADVGRFLTRHILVQGGIAGTGTFGGDPTLESGSGVAALHAFGGALWYFTPGSMASLYTGATYWSQITQRDGPDNGSVLATLGIQGALSSRASLFVEGGYGYSLTRNDEGLPTRMAARIGVRFKL